MPRTRMGEVYSAALRATSYFGSTLRVPQPFAQFAKAGVVRAWSTSIKVPALSLQKPEGQGRGTRERSAAARLSGFKHFVFAAEGGVGLGR